MDAEIRQMKAELWGKLEKKLDQSFEEPETWQTGLQTVACLMPWTRLNLVVDLTRTQVTQ